MITEIKKISKIVSEMTTFFLRNDNNAVEFKVKIEKERSVIEINDNNNHFSEEDLKDLVKAFNQPRQYEMEEYYWQLMGEADDESELTLVAMMVDEAYLERKNNNLYLTLVRHL